MHWTVTVVLQIVMLRPQAKHLGPRREAIVAFNQILRLRSGWHRESRYLEAC